jgi:hypothetical protein
MALKEIALMDTVVVADITAVVDIIDITVVGTMTNIILAVDVVVEEEVATADLMA